MPRREFSKAIKVTVIKRATREGVTYCELCGALAKRFQIDHINPDGLTGEPVLSNAMLICEPCFSVKNPIDTSNIAKAKRREAYDLGATRPKGKLKSRGFEKKERQQKIDFTTRRSIYERIA